MNACIVVAGGSGRRMGGADKAALRVGGVTLLDGVLAAAAPLCSPLVVVGAVRPTSLGTVVFTMEDEPAGGPVPAVLAGLAHVGDAGAVFILAVDLPFLSTAGLRRLVGGLEESGAGAAAAADDKGLPNPLLALYRTDALQAAARHFPDTKAGLPASRLLPPGTILVDLGPRETLNVNTPADLASAQAAADKTG